MFALAPPESHKGVLRTIVAMFGTQGAQLFLALLAIITGSGAVRLLWLTFQGALAVEMRVRGIYVRSTLYTGLVPWSAVTGVDIRTVPGWGPHPLLVVHRGDQPGLLA